MSDVSTHIGEITVHKTGDVFEVYQWSSCRDAGVCIADYPTHHEAHRAAKRLSAHTGLPLFDEVMA